MEGYEERSILNLMLIKKNKESNQRLLEIKHSVLQDLSIFSGIVCKFKDQINYKTKETQG